MKELNILLNEKTMREAKVTAEIEQIPYTTMFRNWITKKVREYAPTHEPPSSKIDASQQSS